ncbi:MAG TPA: phenylalanine--tRNA ligase subunit beta [Candidatus Limnocylindrales bacterium]|nr:phenylalanine--tRNA ligase subunit beta [Candidatus Limnocylindrales bacterium]
MRVPLSWLRDYVDVDLEPERLAERLTLLGMEVQKIEQWGSDWQNVVVGELLTVEPHPRADRLSLATVTLGDGGAPLEIVCGATNIAPGQRVPVALPGAVLPGDRRIERTEKMGVVSNGMLCSGDELNLTSDADGILILPPETPLGIGLTELYGDTVLDIDVKPNRGDALSLVGLAREVAASTGAPVRFPDTDPPDAVVGGPATEQLLAVDVRDPDLCSRFVGRWVTGVVVGPAPDIAQMRLRAAGVRPVSNVVDASNYVMLELGKPIHAFDARAVAEANGRREIIVRRAVSGEAIETLDHVRRTLEPETLVIADRTGPIGIAGVMGGAQSEVGDTTTEVIVESAVFDPVSIRRTGQRYGLRSEASLRFEKGQEFRLARLGADRTARLIVEWSGGTVAPGRVDSAPDEPAPERVAFRPARVNRLLGTRLSTAEQEAVLARVGVATEPAAAGTAIPVAAGSRPHTLEPAAGEDVLVAVVPTWRRDIAIEADVAEEVARVHGYERIPEILPHTPMPHYRHQPLDLRDLVRETLAGAGVTEVVTHALVSPRLNQTFRWESPMPAVEGSVAEGGRIIGVENPLSAEHSVMRVALVGSLVETVSRNLRHGTTDVPIFEIGKGYGHLEGPNGAPREWWRLGIALTGNRRPASWNQPAEPYDLDDVKGLVELVCRRLGFDAPTFEPLRGEPLLHPGRAATVRATHDGRLAFAGTLGELHPSLDDEWELRGARLVVAELDLSGLGGASVPNVIAAPPPRQPAAERDLAVVVAEEQPAGAVAQAIRRHAGPTLESLALFDVYRGAPLAEGEKSLAFRLAFRAAERTLEEAEVDAAIEAVSASLAAEVGGRIRT